eukprot:TRINITY_DN27235_c0_g1_i3.p1 TRINITY_DN27235_c0_g1~~TRINITY_DN27235_c0_g1_i3.p1  ORF type:complete len:160 (+),score=24.31 TRINITY_DN27235_c0_g1_i3:58-480(+)
MAAITVRLQHLKDNAHRNADLLADRREVLDWYSAKKREIAAEKEATQRALVAETSVQMTPTDAGARDTGFADLDCGKSTGRTSRRSMVRRSQAAVSPARTPGDERVALKRVALAKIWTTLAVLEAVERAIRKPCVRFKEF